MMKFSFNSIRIRLMLIFSVTFLLLLSLLVMFTKLFFVSYYVSMNEQTFRTNVNTFIAELRDGNHEVLVSDMKMNTGANVFFYDSALRPMGPQNQLGNDALATYSITDIAQSIENSGEYDYFFVTEDDRGQLMIYGTKMPRSGLIILTKRAGLADEAAALFYRFITILSIIIYIIGILMTYLITRHLTKPILKMKAVTQKMAEQDFSEKLVVKGSDEINALMVSINQMAEQLSTTIHTLSITNEQLAQELTKEQRLETMRRQFVSDVSHELKNPLSMIIGYTDGLIQNITKTDAQREEYYEIIMAEANRMHRLVKDLLDLSGYESGTFTIEKSNFDVNELICEGIERFTYLSEDKNLDVQFDSTENFLVYADRLRLYQVITNLLSNAFKYSNEQGIIHIALDKANTQVKITISNTGKLISPKNLKDVWNSFYQVDTDSNGNGLGLAIVKSIVNLHGGQCKAYTTEHMNCFEVII